MRCKSFSWVITVVLVICFSFIVPAAKAQRMLADTSGQFDALTPLKNALNSAGATALTSAQETSINTLITNFRASHTPTAPGSAASAARTAYDNAIVAGQLSTAEAQIPAIVSEMTANTTTRLQDNAAFMISVIQVLDQAQLSALVKQFGSTGVVRFVEMLGGGPGPGGRPGPGPMGMRRPGSN